MSKHLPMGLLGGSARYEVLLGAIDRARRLVDKLEAQPPSPKRDAALAVLRERQVAVILRLNEIPSDGHRN